MPVFLNRRDGRSAGNGTIRGRAGGIGHRSRWAQGAGGDDHHPPYGIPRRPGSEKKTRSSYQTCTPTAFLLVSFQRLTPPPSVPRVSELSRPPFPRASIWTFRSTAALSVLRCPTTSCSA